MITRAMVGVGLGFGLVALAGCASDRQQCVADGPPICGTPIATQQATGGADYTQRAKNEAIKLKAMTQVRAIGQVGIITGDMNKGMLPLPTEAAHAIRADQSTFPLVLQQRVHPNFDQLIFDNYLYPEILLSPFGPVADDRGDYWMRFGTHVLGLRPDVMMAYDRASYHTQDFVLVAFEDNHVEQVTHERFAELVKALGSDVDVMVPTRK